MSDFHIPDSSGERRPAPYHRSVRRGLLDIADGNGRRGTGHQQVPDQDHITYSVATHRNMTRTVKGHNFG